ncbi:MAG: nucleotidyltransferase substrate binding protein [Legionellales bacterium]|nr:nucleotidyltransferase substrate binding protein [Legionellales bacterium]
MLLDLSALKNAINSLEEAIQYSLHLPTNIKADIVRDSVIQRFEYSYELSWKLLQRWLSINVSPEEADPRTKKDLFRLAAQKKLIDNPEDWFEFAEARNNVAHTYNEKKAQYVYKIALKFLASAKYLLQKLEQANA